MVPVVMLVIMGAKVENILPSDWRSSGGSWAAISSGRSRVKFSGRSWLRALVILVSSGSRAVMLRSAQAPRVRGSMTKGCPRLMSRPVWFSTWS